MTTSLFKTTWRGFIIFCHEIGTNFIHKLLDKDLLTMSRVNYGIFHFQFLASIIEFRHIRIKISKVLLRIDYRISLRIAP